MNEQVNFAYSWGPLGWVIPAEIFDQDLRDCGMALATTANWATNFAIAKLTPLLLLPGWLGLPGTFFFFCGFCVAMGLIVLVWLPETKQIPLEEMARLFKVINLAPHFLPSSIRA